MQRESLLVCAVNLPGMKEQRELLAGFGLDEFSMTASSIPRIKKRIRDMRLQDARQTAAKVLEAETIEEVRRLIGYEK